ncbi:putative amidoligase enzyme-domain-containing protein [Whalleya microplaca]|nr:putative amidoligase enzyme-domain-containing protein [Whalleya microplaca]
MAGSEFTVPMGRRPSVGIELEFILAHLPSDEIDPDGNRADSLPPVLRLDGYGYDKQVAALEHIRDTLAGHGIAVNRIPQSFDEPKDNALPIRLRNIDKWDIGLDTSIDGSDRRGYYWLGVEIRSPAMWARDESYQEIAYVVNLLKSKYRLRVNSSCGFHVHVGNGRNFFTAETIKRLAAFLWAADPMLSRLHAPYRRVSRHSESIRYSSKLACQRGFDAAAAHRLVEREKRRPENPHYGAFDEIPMTTWSDTTREELEYGSKDMWESYAHWRTEVGPFMRLSENIDEHIDESPEDLAQHHKEMMDRYYRHIALLLEHPNPKREITIDAPHIIRRFENLISLLDLEGDQGLHGISRLEYEEAIRTNRGIENLLRLRGGHAPPPRPHGNASVSNSAEGDSTSGAGSPPRSLFVESDGSFSDSPNRNPPSSGGFQPPAWDAIHGALPPGHNYSPSSGGFQPPAWDALHAHPPGNLSAAPSSPFQANVGSEGRNSGHNSGRADSSKQHIRPHDANDLPALYVDRISRQLILSAAHWDSISWLPSVTYPRPYPRAPHDPAECDVSCTDHPSTTTRQGIAEIMACKSAAAAAALVQSTGFRRLNYNFNPYTPDSLDPSYSEHNRRTIEFREAGGSLDAEFIVLWTRICAGIIQWARNGRVDHFMHVLERLERHEDRHQRVAAGVEADAQNQNEEIYDICDLLWDIGLSIESIQVWGREQKHGPPR